MRSGSPRAVVPPTVVPTLQTCEEYLFLRELIRLSPVSNSVQYDIPAKDVIAQPVVSRPDAVEDLLNAQKASRTSIGVVAPREITKVEVLDRPEEDARSFEQKFEDLKKTVDAKRAQIDKFEQAIPPEMKKLDFLKSRVVVSWLCKSKDCSGHNMQVLDWGLCELQRRDGNEAAVKRIKELCKPDTYDLKFFLGNLFQYPASFTIVGLWYPKRAPDLLKFTGGLDVS